MSSETLESIGQLVRSALDRGDGRALAAIAFRRLPQLKGDGWIDHKPRLLKVALADEEHHRKHSPAGYDYRADARDAARALIATDMAHALVTPRPPKWQDVIENRASWLLATALAHANRKAILDRWQKVGIDPAVLLQVEYAPLIK